MMPNPPICISSIIITRPKVVKLFMSITINPVKHTELAAVKNASIGEMYTFVALGKYSIIVPTNIKMAKLVINNKEGFNPRR